jgi:filamentous hemagglutinin
LSNGFIQHNQPNALNTIGMAIPIEGVAGAVVTGVGADVSTTAAAADLSATGGAADVSTTAAAADVSATATPAPQTTLDWSNVSGSGETSVAHVLQHSEINLQKPNQGVFYGDAVDTINDAWAIGQASGIHPIPVGNVDIYLVPRPNSGFASGYAGQSQNLNTVTIVTKGGTPIIITGFPGNGAPFPSGG